jgi:hypothetical protein
MRAGIGETELANPQEDRVCGWVALGHRPDSRLRRKQADAKQEQGFVRVAVSFAARIDRAEAVHAARLNRLEQV